MCYIDVMLFSMWRMVGFVFIHVTDACGHFIEAGVHMIGQSVYVGF